MMNEIEPEETPDQPSEEDFASALPPPVPRGILYERLQLKYAFFAAMFAVLSVVTSLLFWFSPRYRDLLWASPETVFTQGEYWRLVTALFAHADLEHLLSNLPFLFIFGWLLRRYFGLLAFPLAALCVGVLTNGAALYFYRDHLRMVGASGMVYAMVAMWSVFYLRYEIRFGAGKKLLRVTGFLLVLFFPTVYSPTTSYLAHALGFVIGVVCALLLIALGPYDRRQRQLQEPHVTGI